MNAKVRNVINGFQKRIGISFRNIVLSATSILRILVLSRLKVSRLSKKYHKFVRKKHCTVLANGPSLRSALDMNEVRLRDCDVICMNMFVEAPEFWTIKPLFYFIVDDAYFNPRTDRHNRLISVLSEAINKVDWDMYLCVSSGCVHGGVLNNIKNKKVHVIYWNTTVTEGNKRFCYFIYRHFLGMPRCQTVANVAIMSAILLNYKTIYVYGIDHSWTKDISVGNDNSVYYGDRHVYSTGLTTIKQNYDMASLLRDFANMFEAHQIISDFSKGMGSKIFNCTKGSFVDAHERLYDNYE